MSKSQLFIIFVCSFCIGIGVSSFIEVSFFYQYITFLLSLVFLVLCLNKKWIFLLFLIIVGVTVGALRYTLSLPVQDTQYIGRYIDERVSVQGSVYGETVYKNGNYRFKVDIRDQYHGNILVFSKESMVSHGDRVLMSCEIAQPAIFADFNYKQYLFHQHIDVICYEPEIEIVAKKQTILGIIYNLKDRFRDVFKNHLPSTQAGLAQALILGDKQDISYELQDAISAVGLSHIFAISGMHIGMLAFMLLSILSFLRVKKNWAFCLVALLLFVYLVIIGFPSSANRAVLMTCIVFFGVYLNRPINLLESLGISAFILLLFDPHFLFQIGFQLSFAAVLGIHLYYPAFKILFSKLKIPKLFGIQDIISITCAVSMLVLPLTSYYFHQISITSFLSNILILPLLPFLFSSLLFGMIIGVFSYSLSHFVLYLSFKLFSYVLFAVDWLKSIGIVFENMDISLSFLCILYLVILALGFLLHDKCKRKNYTKTKKTL